MASWASVRADMLMWLEKSSMVILMLGTEASTGALLSSQLNWRGRSPRVATQEAWTRSPSLTIEEEKKLPKWVVRTAIWVSWVSWMNCSSPPAPLVMCLWMSWMMMWFYIKRCRLSDSIKSDLKSGANWKGFTCGGSKEDHISYERSVVLVVQIETVVDTSVSLRTFFPIFKN